MIQRAVDQDPENAAYRDSLGWVLFRKGRLAEALPELEKSVALEADDPAVLDTLAMPTAPPASPIGPRTPGSAPWAAFQKSGGADEMRNVEEKIEVDPVGSARKQVSPFAPRKNIEGRADERGTQASLVQG